MGLRRTHSPDPAPELPRFDTYVMEGFRDIGWADLPCNYVQIMENAVDPHHVEFLHGRYFEFIGQPRGLRRPAVVRQEAHEGRLRPLRVGHHQAPRAVEGASEENDDWKIGHPLVFPYNMRVGGGGMHQMQIRVPINRTTTRFMLYTVHAPEQGYEQVEQPMIPEYELPVFDDRGHHVINYVEGQDMMAWVTQGPITDRTTEHLGRSDVGVALLRKMFREQMRAVAKGRDPLGMMREPHERIDLPCEKDKFNAAAPSSPSPSATWARRASPPCSTPSARFTSARRSGGGQGGRPPSFTPEGGIGTATLAPDDRRAGGLGLIPGEPRRGRRTGARARRRSTALRRRRRGPPARRAAVLPALRGGPRRRSPTSSGRATAPVFYCWCPACAWTGEIADTRRDGASGTSPSTEPRAPAHVSAVMFQLGQAAAVDGDAVDDLQRPGPGDRLPDQAGRAGSPGWRLSSCRLRFGLAAAAAVAVGQRPSAGPAASAG